jgi:hypothetical protein
MGSRDIVLRAGGCARFHVVSDFTEPTLQWDHGFLDDGSGNIDPKKRSDPTWLDEASRLKWEAILTGAKWLRGDLADATQRYDHFLNGKGETLFFSYEQYVSGDKAGAIALESAIADTRRAAIDFSGTGKSFKIESDPVKVGTTTRYPYPLTENWQKSMGYHVIWIEATVGVDDSGPDLVKYTVEMILHAEDRFNFNPTRHDFATDIQDNENGRFEQTGQAHEFLQLATLRRKLDFTVEKKAGCPTCTAKDVATSTAVTKLSEGAPFKSKQSD